MRNTEAFKKRIRRIRSKVGGTVEKPRISVFRSNKYIYVQMIDDVKGRTLLAVNEKEIEKPAKSQTKTEKARLIGQLLAQKAKAKKITGAVFDRHGYKYHGRVKALAEGARSEGLKF
ncbi:MAG: 50S ribosomal protein L18 [Patescibacteria group bacterium]|nr:50S ribosomal protein L18 [Patescibacteria group bacterium]